MNNYLTHTIKCYQLLLFKIIVNGYHTKIEVKSVWEGEEIMYLRVYCLGRHFKTSKSCLKSTCTFIDISRVL